MTIKSDLQCSLPTDGFEDERDDKESWKPKEDGMKHLGLAEEEKLGDRRLEESGLSEEMLREGEGEAPLSRTAKSVLEDLFSDKSGQSRLLAL